MGYLRIDKCKVGLLTVETLTFKHVCFGDCLEIYYFYSK